MKNINIGLFNGQKLSPYHSFVVERFLDGLSAHDMENNITVYENGGVEDFHLVIIPFLSNGSFADPIRDVLSRLKGKNCISCLLVLDDFDFVNFPAKLNGFADVVSCVKDSDYVLALGDASYENCFRVNKNTYKLLPSSFVFNGPSPDVQANTLSNKAGGALCNLVFYGFGGYLDAALAMQDAIRKVKEKYQDTVKVQCIVFSDDEKKQVEQYFRNCIDVYFVVSGFNSFLGMLNHIRKNRLVDIGIGYSLDSRQTNACYYQAIDFLDMGCSLFFNIAPSEDFVHMNNCVVASSNPEMFFDDLDVLINSVSLRNALCSGSGDLPENIYGKVVCYESWKPITQAVIDNRGNKLFSDEWDVFSEHTSTVLPPIMAGVQYSQSFEALHGRIIGFAFLFGTYGKRLTNDIVLGLSDVVSGQTLFNQRFSIDKVEDNNWYSFEFLPVAVNKGEQYELTVASQNHAIDDAFTLYTNNNKNGFCFKDGVPVEYSICVRIVFQK